MLQSNQESWLRANGFRLEGEISTNAIPILLEGPDNNPVFLPGYGCVGGKQRALFIVEAPQGLWLGGGAVVVRVPEGVISIPDRRHGGQASAAAQGWAKYDEGESLEKAAAREFTEELTFYTLAGEGDDLYQPCTEIVPFGIEPKGYVRSLNQTLADVQVYGELKFFYWCKGDSDRDWVYVTMWDLRDLLRVHRLRVIWDDDFPKDLHPGSNPRVLSVETGVEIGRYEGAQGYLPNNLAFTAVVRDGLKALAALE